MKTENVANVSNTVVVTCFCSICNILCSKGITNKPTNCHSDYTRTTKCTNKQQKKGRLAYNTIMLNPKIMYYYILIVYLHAQKNDS